MDFIKPGLVMMELLHELFFALLAALSDRNHPVTGRFPYKMLGMWKFGVPFIVNLNKRLHKKSSFPWSEKSLFGWQPLPLNVIWTPGMMNFNPINLSDDIN